MYNDFGAGENQSQQQSICFSLTGNAYVKNGPLNCARIEKNMLPLPAV